VPFSKLAAFVLLGAAPAAAPWRSIPLPFTLVNGETARKPLPATMPGGLAVFDYDGDGNLDIFLPNGGQLPSGRKAPDKLLRNLGGMKFEDVTAKAGLAGKDYSFAAAVGDYDSDGRPDLLVCGLHGVVLYRNRPDGRFEDVTGRAGIDNHGRWTTGAAWFDMDGDGDLDLFIVNYVVWNTATERECIVNGKADFCHPKYYDPLPNALFRNNGDGTFTDVSDASGIAANPGKGMAVSVADFDGDGRPDVFVTNDRIFASMFHNVGGGRFEEVAFDWGVAAPMDGTNPSGMGTDAQDFDNDGRPDLIYAALQDETFPLYRNTGRGFAEVTATSRVSVLSRQMAGWGILFADLDNDGWKDLVVARSGALAGRKESVSWFRNLSDGKFAAGGDLDPGPEMFRGVVAADMDGDGCLDLVVTALNAPARILRNPCRGGNWLAVDSHSSRVRVGNQWREPSSATGYGSSYYGPLHFGLGTAQTADVEVSGRVTPGVRANQVFRP
jgi:hypothetical protein